MLNNIHTRGEMGQAKRYGLWNLRAIDKGCQQSGREARAWKGTSPPVPTPAHLTSGRPASSNRVDWTTAALELEAGRPGCALWWKPTWERIGSLPCFNRGVDELEGRERQRERRCVSLTKTMSILVSGSGYRCQLVPIQGMSSSAGDSSVARTNQQKRDWDAFP
ncbi:uncharacterized protein MYCFIDRAFT_211142, partial [Pseudocercospora fijiensis CIRAD86]